jgi:hypothetical protein
LTDAEKASILRSIAHEGSRQCLVLGVAKTQVTVLLKGHGPRPGSRTGQMELWSDFPISIASTLMNKIRMNKAIWRREGSSVHGNTLSRIGTG